MGRFDIDPPESCDEPACMGCDCGDFRDREALCEACVTAVDAALAERDRRVLRLKGFVRDAQAAHDARRAAERASTIPAPEVA